MDKKALYLSKNFSELQKLTETAKLELNNVKIACNLLDKLYEKHEQAFLDRDEELAYVYVMRFLDSLSKTRKLFKSDIKYINAFVNASKVNISVERAEKLKDTLKERYELLLVIKNTADKKEEEMVTGVVAGQSNGLVTCKEVYGYLKNGKKQLLIVDTRSRAEFVECHISGKMVVNVPSVNLHAGCSVVDVDKLIKKIGDDLENNVWQQRSVSTTVIITNWDMFVLNGVSLVKDAIYKWDAEKIINEPVLLDGGLKTFLLHYPTMVTNPQYKGPNEGTKSDIVDPGDIKYPNWDAIEANKKKKKAEEDEQMRVLKEMDNKRRKEGGNDDNVVEKVNDHSPKQPVNDRSLEDRIKDHIPEHKHNPSVSGTKITDNNDKAILTSEVASLIIDRSLKPDINKHSDLMKPKDAPSSPRLTKDIRSIRIDRTLKPDLFPDTKKDHSVIPINTTNIIKDVSPDKPGPLRRLSSNSRTDQDRSDFTARGGAKSIAPPSDQGNIKLPPWISRELDSDTNEYFYYDKKTNKRYKTLPVEGVETRTDTGMTKNYVDRVEVLKDHSMHTSKQTPATSSMKRSTSQPNLSDEVVIDSKSTVNNAIELGSSHGTNDVPRLDRLTKPSISSTFNEQLSASRLQSFNPAYRTVTPGLTGLRNMGNTCYMNSVVQALSNTKFLTNYIVTNSYLHDINVNNPLGYKGDLVREFALLIKALWKGQYKEISPTDFKRMVDSKNEMFFGGEQHDSQEFLLFLLDGLHEDQNSGQRHPKMDVPSIDNDQMEDAQRAHLSWKAHLAVNDSVIVRMFQGQYRSKVTCDHCLASSVTFDAFMYLSLPLVTSHNRCSLDDCIKLFLAEEKMTGASQWFCPKCKTNRNARKKIDIWKLPPYLLIHLKSGQYREKLNTFVDFPIETLSLGEIVSGAIPQAHKHSAYHLYAVSNHHGNMESGHCEYPSMVTNRTLPCSVVDTSYCKNVRENAWYNYDDDVVTRINESDVKTPSAYILFYESYNLKKATYKN